MAGPHTGQNKNAQIPNEDSLDFEFTDQNLFSLNRFPGIDRLEGGARANVGLHTALTTDTGVKVLGWRNWPGPATWTRTLRTT